MFIPSKMKQYCLPQFTGFSNLMLLEVETPVPKPGEVLVKIHVVSFAVNVEPFLLYQYRDLMVARGAYPKP
ncbi:hypothetical protein C8J56DRAFT_1051295 [Mycena floridula]|nr:hypothetical protein C8J56DRAFT_1051295 [Mycena floridula]